MVFIGLGANDRVIAAFEAYAPAGPDRRLRRRREHRRERSAGRARFRSRTARGGERCSADPPRVRRPTPVPSVTPSPSTSTAICARPRPRERSVAAGATIPALLLRPPPEDGRHRTVPAAAAPVRDRRRLPDDPRNRARAEAVLDVDRLPRPWLAQRPARYEVVTGHFPLCVDRPPRRALRHLHRAARAGRADAVVPAPPTRGRATLRRGRPRGDLRWTRCARGRPRHEPHGADALADRRRDDRRRPDRHRHR